MMNIKSSRVVARAMSARFMSQNLVKRPQFKDKYDNFIGGKFVPPGKVFVFAPVTNLKLLLNSWR